MAFTLEKAKEKFRVLENLVVSVGKYEGIEATPYRRKELAGLIKKYVDMGIIVRQDNKGEINLSTDTRREHNMAADVTITLSKNNTFNIMDCCLWGTLSGLNELITEWNQN